MALQDTPFGAPLSATDAGSATDAPRPTLGPSRGGRPRTSLVRAGRLVGFASLGPITGPLAAGLAGAVSNRRWIMAAVWALAIVEAWALQGAVALWLGRHVIGGGA